MADKPTIAIIVAGGRGSRLLGDGLPKQYQMLGETCVLQKTIEAFTSHERVDQVVVVIHRDDEATYDKTISPHAKLVTPIHGGNTRQKSVWQGLQALAGQSAPEKVLIHDAARPFVEADVIDEILDITAPDCAAIPAFAIAETLKRVGEQVGKHAGQLNAVEQTISRENLYGAQTPQGFMFEEIFELHRVYNQQTNNSFTDDASLFESAGKCVKLVSSPPTNFKITTIDDLDRARMMVSSTGTTSNIQADIRTGNGYDVHAFEPGNAVVLCGVKIPFSKKLKGHSDADAPLHALTDALLGTIGAGDIGTYFPPSDNKWKNASSDIFLKEALNIIVKKGGRLNNVDLTIICEAPKIGPHREKMQAQLMALCNLELERVNIKATTNEKLGFLGRGEGIAAIASATVSFGVRT